MKFNKFFVFIVAVFSFIFSGYSFPEAVPSWNELYILKFNDLEFGKTTVSELKSIAPKLNNSVLVGKYTIFQEDNINTEYKSIRLGFNSESLEWIEFKFNSPKNFSEFKKIYGEPLNINSKYSSTYNYADYPFFNLLLDKSNTKVFAINLFGLSGFSDSDMAMISHLPNFNRFNDVKFFIAGELFEEDYNLIYNNKKLQKPLLNRDYAIYKINPEFLVLNKNYSNVQFVFKNGLLNFISLTPKNLDVNKIFEIYGKKTLIEDKTSNKVFYDYDNFSVKVDSKTGNVLNVGIFGSNSSK